MNILKEKAYPLLKRKRITAELEHFKKPTPSKPELLKILSSTLKLPEEKISLLHAYPHFGRDKTKIIANIYESKEARDLMEKINKKVAKKAEAPNEPAPKPAGEK